MLAHLANYQNDATRAFSPEGIEEMNRNIQALNNNQPHQPIRKVRIYEKAEKFAVGTTGNKKYKFVEAAKGTNLYFGVYKNSDGARTFDTIPLNIVIARQKQGLPSIPEKNEDNDELLFGLSPNDLVYVPTKEEIENKQIETIDRNRIYKMVSSNKKQCFFIPQTSANTIVNKFEYSAANKMEKSIYDEMIKDICIPICIDRLGNIIKLDTSLL